MNISLWLAGVTTTLISLVLVLPASAQNCPGPYRVLTSDNRCVWSCAPGTQPDRASNQCVCQPGLSVKGRDSLGRILCSRQREQQAAEPPTNHSADHPYNVIRYDLCSAYARTAGQSPHPYRCSSRTERPAERRILRQLEIIVTKGRPGSAEVKRIGRYQVRFNQPPNPPPNRDCNAAITGVANACRRSCLGVENFPFYESGSLRGLLAANGPEPKGCGRSFRSNYEPGTPTKAKAYDACSRQANRKNLRRWNHDVAISIPLRFAASFGFHDPRTTGTQNNWKLHAQVQHMFRQNRLNLPVIVRCRQG